MSGARRASACFEQRDRQRSGGLLGQDHDGVAEVDAGGDVVRWQGVRLDDAVGVELGGRAPGLAGVVQDGGAFGGGDGQSPVGVQDQAEAAGVDQAVVAAAEQQQVSQHVPVIPRVPDRCSRAG